VLHGTSSDDLDQMYTLGCFGIRKSEWPRFKQDLAKYAETHDGQHPYINIAPDRSLTITDKPMWGKQIRRPARDQHSFSERADASEHCLLGAGQVKPVAERLVINILA
jgi:hypothetical protein